jgi:hypothetical protein
MYCDRRIAKRSQWFFEPPKDAYMRVPDNVKDCVVFLGRVRTDGMMEKKELLGTAFIVVMKEEGTGNLGKSFLYLVSAKHVIDGLQGATCGVRINNLRETGGSSLLLAPTKWWTHPSDHTADVAVMPFGPPPEAQLNFTAFPTEAFATAENIEKTKIGVGDEVFITGLFAPNIGEYRNLPIVRMGNVALMAGDPVPVHGYYMEAHLIEARSLGGLSGSPAFVRQTISVGFADPKNFDEHELWKKFDSSEAPPDALGFFLTGIGPFYLLGLMHGHWDIAAKQKNEVLLSGDRDGAVNMGIALVTPATKILETLQHPELIEMRKEISKRAQEGLPPVRLDALAQSQEFAPIVQKTRQGLEIPVPSRSQIMGDLRKATRKKK